MWAMLEKTCLFCDYTSTTTTLTTEAFQETLKFQIAP